MWHQTHNIWWASLFLRLVHHQCCLLTPALPVYVFVCLRWTEQYHAQKTADDPIWNSYLEILWLLFLTCYKVQWTQSSHGSGSKGITLKLCLLSSGWRRQTQNILFPILYVNTDLLIWSLSIHPSRSLLKQSSLSCSQMHAMEPDSNLLSWSLEKFPAISFFRVKSQGTDTVGSHLYQTDM